MASASAGGGTQGQQAMAALLARRAAAAGAGDNNSNKSTAFSLTCSRLSQYLKEKGALNLGGIGFDMARPFDAPANKGTGTSRPETPRTMNLLPGIDSVPAVPAAAAPTEQQLLHTAAPAPPPPPQQPTPRGAQMTIFYGGKVIVFDNYPADKAKEILALAGRGTSATPHKPQGPSVLPPPPNCAAAAATATALPLPVKTITNPTGVAPAAADTLCAPPAAAAATVVPAPPALAVVAPAAVAPAAAAPPVSHKPPAVPLASDLPIARRVSLNRFLEKRKDRINSKAPYPVNAAGASSSDAKPVPNKDKQPMPLLEKDKQPPPPQQQSWLGLAPSDSL